MQISSGFTNEQSPQGRAFSGDLLDQNRYSPGLGGPWLQMTTALLTCILCNVLEHIIASQLA